MDVKTDVSGPSAPVLTNLTCKDESSIWLQWEPPRIVYRAVDVYQIYYRSEDQWRFKEVTVETGADGSGSLFRGAKV